ncbi:MAG: PTS sugar transporter subunit IIA [Polyangiaceae bacterium]|nr:PTS sugar transporter subunit IIA [Polyangiaceae bacterium]
MISREEWRANLAPATTVFLISIPLSMGIAIASGVPPARGLLTAIIGGIVIGRLAGSPLQISGPSAGLAVMVLDLVNTHGLVALPFVVVLMGLLQMAAGMLKLGQVFRAVSPAVINGMLAGIGVLIFSAQFHVMVDDEPKASGLRNLLSIPEAVYKGLSVSDGTVHHWAALIGVLTLGILIGMTAIKSGPLKKVPPSLVAVSVATAAIWLLDIPIRRVHMPPSFQAALAVPGSEVVGMFSDAPLVLLAVAFAFVASAETLLCANAVDAMHEGPRTNYDRELFAQGVGNTVCGLVGALPTTGVITRSTANVEAGATSRASALMVGGLVLIVMALFPQTLQIIPRASLAALLVFIGFKLVRGRPYAELKGYGRSELAIFGITVTAIVSINLLTGIMLGIGLAVAKLLISGGAQFHRFEITTAEADTGDLIHLHLRGAASFLRLPRLATSLEALPQNREIHLHVEELSYIDHACLDLLTRWERGRMRTRAPVRVQWQTLHHRYHVRNRLDETPEDHATEPEEGELLNFLQPPVILVEPEFRDKWHAIEMMCQHLINVDKASDGPLNEEKLTASVVQREHEVTTCVGYGLMVPHGALPERHPMLGVMAVSKQGWDFEAPDGEPVRCIVLLATPPEEAARHLAVLAAFARLFTRHPELRERVLLASSPEEVFAQLRGDEARSINYAFETKAQ